MKPSATISPERLSKVKATVAKFSKNKAEAERVPRTEVRLKLKTTSHKLLVALSQAWEVPLTKVVEIALEGAANEDHRPFIQAAKEEEEQLMKESS